MQKAFILQRNEKGINEIIKWNPDISSFRRRMRVHTGVSTCIYRTIFEFCILAGFLLYSETMGRVPNKQATGSDKGEERIEAGKG